MQEQQDQTLSWSRRRIAIVGAIVLAVCVAAFLVLSRGWGLSGTAQNAGNFLDGFSKLVVSEAYAKDNFTLTASQSDSLGVEPNSRYVLASKDDISTEAIRSGLTLEPAVPFTVEPIEKGKWEIALAQGLEPNEQLRISLPSVVQEEDGSEKERLYEWAFQVKDSFALLHTLPRNEATRVPMDTGIEVTFSHEQVQRAEDFFTIDPRVDGRFEYHGRTVVFVPNETLKPATLYTVTVKQGIGVVGSDDVLAEDYVFAFETAEEEDGRYSGSTPWFDVNQKYIDASTKEAPLVNLYARNLKSNKLDVVVYRLNNVDEYMSFVQKLDELPRWSAARNNMVLSTEGRTPVSTFVAEVHEENYTQILNFPEPLDAGYYMVNLSQGEQTRQVWLQVTDLAAYVNVAYNKTLIWSFDLDTKSPSRGAEIHTVPAGETEYIGYDGVALFDTPDVMKNKEEDQSTFFHIEHGEKDLVFPASASFNTPNDEVFWDYLYTDRPLYQPKDTIQLWGVIKGKNGPVGGEVTLTLSKSGYVNYFYEEVDLDSVQVRPDALGAFSASFDIEHLKPGAYTITLLHNGNYVTNRWISVEQYTKPAYNLTILPEKNVALAGENVQVVVQAEFFDGTPVPDLELLVSGHGKTETQKTDSDGRVVIAASESYQNCTSSYSCWPRSSLIEVRPVLEEYSDLATRASIRFYGPMVDAYTHTEYPEAGKAKTTVRVRKLDLRALEEEPWWRNIEEDPPSVGTKVKGTVTKVTYTKKKTGTHYDFINKRSYDTYSYTRHEEDVDVFEGVTDEEGNFVYERDVEEETSYILTIDYFDEEGRYDRVRVYMYYHDGHGLYQYTGATQGLYQLEFPEGKEVAVGDTVPVAFVKDGVLLTEGEDNHFLYLQHQRGFQSYEATDVPSYEFQFTQEDIPNVHVTGVYFNGSTFVKAETGWEGNSVRLDTDEKKMDIFVEPTKQEYAPGEEVTLRLRTIDKDGTPVPAAVNLNLIDEAYYAVADAQANPAESIYAPVASGVVISESSHAKPNNAFGGAEKGGCFVAGTQIEMADGSFKAIEDVVQGDMVRTFADPLSRKKVVGVVAETVKHVVSEIVTINGTLETTPEHLIYVNGTFAPAGTIEEGDVLLNSAGKPVIVHAVEMRREILPVYNFAVDPQHTYIAGGFYVHNEKGGGPREFFTDAALFETVTTDANGQGSITFILPDNITSWRVTAQGVSSQMDVGLSVTKIPVTLPVFVDATLADEFVVGDKPVARLRSFGDALNRDDTIELSLGSEDLGINNPQVLFVKAYESAYVALPVLDRPGAYRVVHTLRSKKGDDAIAQTISVVPSRLVVTRGDSKDAVDGATVKNKTSQPMSVVFTDVDRNQAYHILGSLRYTWGDRIDQRIAREESRKLMNEYYWNSYWEPPAVNVVEYQGERGGVTLLPYSGEELALSARVAAVRPDGFDQVALRQYFFNILENTASNNEQVSLALYGLAALGEPVLPRLQIWLERDDLSVKEQLYVALAAKELGDGERARAVYQHVIEDYAYVREPHVIINVGKSREEIVSHTLLTAALATELQTPEEDGLWGYLQYHHLEEFPLYLEQVQAAKSQIARAADRPATIMYEINGKEKIASLKSPYYAHTDVVPPEGELSVTDGEEGFQVAISEMIPLAESNVPQSTSVNLRREYLVNGKVKNTFKTTDLVEVRLHPEISYAALDGQYQVTDVLPTGLAPVTKLYFGWSYGSCNKWYPYDTDEQLVRYMISKNFQEQACSRYIGYYARPTMKGTYRAEAATIQSTLNPDILFYTEESTITIE